MIAEHRPADNPVNATEAVFDDGGPRPRIPHEDNRAMLALANSAPQYEHMDGESKDVRLPVMIGKDDAASQCWHLADGISTKAAAVHRLIGTSAKAKPLLSDMYVWLDGSGVASEGIAKALERLRKSRGGG